MTDLQHDLLTLICDGTSHDGDCTDSPIARYWMPANKGYQYSATLKKEVHVCGSGVAACLKSMAKKGWITPHQRFKYAYAITEDGRLNLEKQRELIGFYNHT